MQLLLAYLFLCGCTLAVAGQASSGFLVRVSPAAAAGLPSVAASPACLAGSVSSMDETAVISRGTGVDRFCLAGRSYRFLTLSGRSHGDGVSSPWGGLPMSRGGFEVYYDPTLAPPAKTNNSIYDNGTLEIQVVW